MSANVFRSAEGQRAVLGEYDRLVEGGPAKCRSLRVPTRFGDAHLLAGGDPAYPPLVLLHPAGLNSVFWGEELARFSRFFRTYAVDLPGEAGKSAPSRLTLDAPAFGDWLADTLDALGLAETSVLGSSHGGAVALRFAVDRAERVERLVLVAPGGIAQPRASLPFKVLPLALLGRFGRRRMRRTILGPEQLPVALDDYLDLIMQHVTPAMGREYLFSDAELRRLTMPVLLVTGAKDAVRNSPRVAQRMRRLLPRCEHRDCAGMGHRVSGIADLAMPFLSRPIPGDL